MRAFAVAVLVASMVLVGPARASARAGAHTVADDGAAAEEQAESSGDMCDPEFMDHYFPFVLPDGLSEPVDEIVVLTFVLNILPFGALWAPLILLPDDAPDINTDILLSALIPWIAGWGIAVGFGMVGAVLSIPTAGICGVVSCLGIVGLVPACYMAPIAVLQAWDRAYRCSGETSTGFEGLRKKKSKDGDADSGPKTKKKKSGASGSSGDSAKKKPAGGKDDDGYAY